MPTLADLEYAYLGTLGATGTTLLDRQFQIYGASKHAYFAALSGLTPASFFSLQDHKYAYYSNVSGLTPKSLYSLQDHQAKFWATPPPSGPTLTYMQNTIDPANLATYTFAAQPIGAASGTRRVVVALTTSSARLVSSATIGGVAATLDTQYSLVGTARVAIISAVVPTGTTADVEVTLDSAASYMGIALWTLSSGNFVTEGSATGTNPSIPLTTTAGDAVVALAHTSGVSVAAFAWTPSGVERWNADVEVATETYSGTDATAVGASTTIGLTASGANTIAVAAVYR